MGISIVFLVLPLPPWEEQRGTGIAEIAENYGIFPPLGILTLASIARKHGHDALFLDANAHHLSVNAISTWLRDANPDVVCLTLQTQILPATLKVLRQLRKGLDFLVLGGGPHVELYREKTLGASEIDYAIFGHIERAFPLFLDAVAGDVPFEEVPGLIYRGEGLIHSNPGLSPSVGTQAPPWPARWLLDPSRYHSLISQYHPYATMMSTSGCPYACTFCEQGRTRPESVSAKRVVAELHTLVSVHSVREVEFFDPVFTLDRERVMDICQGIINHGLQVKWSARTRVDLVDEELLSFMVRAGCIRLYVGIESADEDILAFYRKEFTVADARRGVRMIKDAGILVFGFFIFGAPLETESSIRASIELAKSLDLDYVQFNVLVAGPHTPLFAEYFSADYWGALTSGDTDIPTPCERFSRPELERWARKAYFSFYFRPGYIWRFLRRTRGLQEIRNTVGVAFHLLRSAVGSKAYHSSGERVSPLRRP